YHGGAIHNHGQLTLIDSTVSGSSSTKGGWGGGGITNAPSGVAMLENVTFSGDSTASRGGAVENLGKMTLVNVTISQSSAPAAMGGGIYAGNTTTLKNTIVAEDTAGGDCAGAIVSVGNNLFGDATCAPTAPTDLTSTNPLL